MSETYTIIQKIKQSIKDDIEDCGHPKSELEPIAYGVVLGLKGALANINAIEALYYQEEKGNDEE